MKSRCRAGIDVHKKMLAVVVRRESTGEPERQKRKFGTTRLEIQSLAAWLQHHGVDEVVMESTAQYWRPVWHGLEGLFQLTLVNPMEARARRGRKWDFRDAERLGDRWYADELHASFIPGAEQRQWRYLTRTRVNLRRMIGVIRNRVECLLEQGGYKLTSVASDAFGASGWAMLKAIVRGETDVQMLAAEARGQLKKKDKQLQEALMGRLDPVYRMLLQQNLEQVEMLRRQMEDVNQALIVAMKDHTATLVRLCKMPGVDLAAAQELLAEIGPKAAAFPSAGQFVSWVGLPTFCQGVFASRDSTARQGAG